MNARKIGAVAFWIGAIYCFVASRTTQLDRTSARRSMCGVRTTAWPAHDIVWALC